MLVQDTFEKAVKKVARLREPSWTSFMGSAWEKVSAVMLAALDELRKHGMSSPLSAMQDFAFHRSLKHGAVGNADRSVHTVALWLTDTRVIAERYRESGGDVDRRKLEERGLLKKKRRQK